jgi:hypothetical protein
MLATCYYRLKQKDKGDAHSAIAERLRLERQDRQAQPGPTRLPAVQPAPPSQEK